jgi:outer membrane autotransporter protein
LSYTSDTASAFTDSSGAAFGAERQHVWDAGVSTRLFAMIPNNGVTWIPYAGTGVAQEFGYRDSEFIPGLADTLFFGSAQTFWKAQVGVAARLPNRFTVGVRGEFADSQEFQVWGGRVYVLYSFD